MPFATRVNDLATRIGAEIKSLRTGIANGSALPTRLGPLSQVVADWNSATSTGWYNGNNTTINGPTADYYIGHVIVYDANWVSQFLYPLNGPLRWRRDKDANVWGPWTLVDSSAPDRPGGYQTNGYRRAAFQFGNGGWSSATTTTYNSANQRVPFVLQVPTKQWRLRISNKNSAGITTGTVPVTISEVRIAEAFKAFADGQPNGWVTNIGTALTNIVVPAGGGDVVTPWVTASNLQITKPGTYYMLNMAWTKASGTIYSGASGSFISANAADITNDLLAPGYTGQTYLNITLEYEFESDKKVILCIGDSNTEAFGPRFAYNIWHQRVARRLGIPVVGIGYGGTTMQGWAAATATNYLWSSILSGAYNADAAIIMLGTNDHGLATPRTVAEFGNDLTSVHGKLKDPLYVGGPPVRDIYALTVPPAGRTAGSTQETTRIAYNTFLTHGSSYALDVFDIATALEAGVGNINNRTQFRAWQFPGEAGTANTDPVHFSNWGHGRIAEMIQVGTA